MKICCDKCNRTIERNIFGKPINVTIIIVPTIIVPGLISDEKYYLCKECIKKFRRFIDNKERDSE